MYVKESTSVRDQAGIKTGKGGGQSACNNLWNNPKNNPRNKLGVKQSTGNDTEVE